MPFFRRSPWVDRLQQLAELGPAAPGWLVNRWLTIQARRRVWTGGDEAATKRVLQLVVPLVHPEAIPFEKIGCAYPEQVMPFIYERDWVVRQVDVYELGALRRLVQSVASPELLERADQIEGWCVAPMRAYRVEDPKPGAIAVRDLTSGETFEVLDLGARLEPGDHLLARVVPTSVEPGLMFDWRPLPVSEPAAHAVARNPAAWLTTLHSVAVGGHLAPAYSHLPEASLTADLPYRAWLSLVGVPLDETPDHDPTPHLDEALGKVIELASRGAEAIAADRHLIGELVLDPMFSNAVRWRYASAEFLPQWRLLSEVLPEHARARCAEMVLWCDAAPELPEAIA